MVTPFEWSIVGLIALGVVVPLWVVLIGAFVRARRERARVKQLGNPGPVKGYAELMREFEILFRSGEDAKMRGLTLQACIRELKQFPQYRDMSIRLLENLNINGSGDMVDALKNEIKQAENQLLGVDED